MKNKAKFMKKLKYGSMAAIVTAIVIAIVIVVNIIMGAVMNRYPIKADLTQDKRYELCDETKDFLKNMKSDVEISVMYPKETLSQISYYNMIPSILDKYEVYAKSGEGSITVNYYDVTKDPDVVTKYSKYYNGTISQGSLVVYCDEQVKVSNITTFFTQDSSSATSAATDESSIIFIGESTITSDIMSVTDANPLNAGLLLYMNEDTVFSDMATYSMAQLYSLLDSNGYTCSELDVMTDKITTEDYDLIVIPAPEVDFSEDVITQLEDFLYNDGAYGKNVMFVSSPYASELPNLEEFIAKWGVQIEDSMILDDESSVAATLYSLNSQTSMAAVGTIANSDAVGELPNASLPIAVPFSRALTVISKNSDITTSVVLQSSATSYQRPIGEDTEFDSSTAEKGVNNFVTLSTRQVQVGDGFDVSTSNVMVIGSLFITDPSVMGNTSAYNNANFILNAVNTMTGKENSVVIPQKNLEQQVITVDQGQLNSIRNVVVYIIPAITVICGLVVFVRRRNR